MPRSRRSAFRHQFQCISGELHAPTSRAFGPCCNEKLHKSICFQRLPCLHVHHPVHNSCRGPLWVSVFAQHVKARGKERSLLHAKPGSLIRELILLHQTLYHSTLCCKLKQPRTLAHMSSAESRETTLAASGGVVMRGSARMYALAPRYLRMRKHSALYLACCAYVQI